MKRKEWMKVYLTVALSAAFFITAQAASITADQAKTEADRYAPSGSAYLRTKDDDAKFEVKYYHETKLEKYDIDVSKVTGKMTSFESEKYNHRGSGVVKLTEDQAKAAVTREISDAEIISVYLDYDDGKEYEVKFKTDGYYGDYSIHAETGEVLERDIHAGNLTVSYGTDDTAGLLSYDKIVELAQRQVPGGTVADVDLDWEDGLYLYEVDVYKDEVEHKLGYDAKSGELIWNYTEIEDWSWYDSKKNGRGAQADSSEYIGLEKAKSIAMAKVPGAYLKKIKLDYDHGYAKYEGELYKDGWEYEFEIDAVTGAIIEWDKDFDD